MKIGSFEPGIASRYGGHVWEEVSGTLRADPGDNRMTVYGIDLLAGRGGANYTVDISPTIIRGDRTMHGVVYGIDQQGGKSGANYTEDISPTVLSDSHGTPHAIAFENHGQDTRFKESGDVSQTVSATFGMGGNNTPFIVERREDG